MKLGITGMTRSGKTTLCNYLVDKYGFTLFNFGDPLKHYAKELFPESFEGGKPRSLLIKFGQSMRDIEPDIWVNKTFKSIHEFESISPNPLILVGDVRQPNEVKRLRDEGYILIRVNSNSKIRIQRMLDNGDNFTLDDLNDITEESVNHHKVDYDIFNTGNLDSLYAQLEDILNDIGR